MISGTYLDPVHDVFPYRLRDGQQTAIEYAADIFRSGKIGLLSADCGVGKTIAVLSAFVGARLNHEKARLVVLTRTHSQSSVFEEECLTLADRFPIIGTSMVSRVHVCPNVGEINKMSDLGFIRGCAYLVRTGKCSYYHSFYDARGDRGQLRENAHAAIEEAVARSVVDRSTAEGVSRDWGICPYELLRWCAKRSNVIIGPYAYLLKSRVREAFLSSLDLSIDEIDLLVDEAHNLPEQMAESESASITGQDIQWLREHKHDLSRETGYEWLEDVIEFLWDTFTLNTGRLHHGGEQELNIWEVLPRFAVEADISLLLTKTGYVQSGDDVIAAETPADRLLDFLYTAILASESSDQDDWHITFETGRTWDENPRLSHTRLCIRPLNTAGLCSYLVHSTRSAVLMSGTLRPTSHYATILGMRDAEVCDIASPYPVGSRLVLIDKNLNTAYKNRSPSLYGALAKNLSLVLTHSPANKSAVVAFSSYAIMNDVLSYGVEDGFRRRVVEERHARVDDIREMLLEEPSVLYSVYGGKFSEGVDLVDGGASLLDLVVGVGIPFAPPTSYHLALQSWYNRRLGEGRGYYYAAVMPALRRVVQLVGRLRRSPADLGVVVLLDNRFLRHVSMLGPRAAADTWPYSTEDELIEAIEMFWRNAT